MAAISEVDQNLLNSIDTYSWHVIKVMGDETGPEFGYSVGLYKTFGHPEIVIVGLNLDLIHSLINGMGEDVRSGKRFESGKFYPDILDGFDCFFTTVTKRHYNAYVGRAQWYYGNDNFPLLQCIYPTKKNVYPWQAEWPEKILGLQPVLAPSLLWNFFSIESL